MSLADSWAALQIVEKALSLSFMSAYPTVEQQRIEQERISNLSRHLRLIEKRLHEEYAAYVAQLQQEAPHD